MRPNTSEPTNVIWNATRMFSAPAPKNTKITAAIVANHGRTPARRITASSSAAATRCNTTASAWYGV